MSEVENTGPDELTVLKERATKMNLKFHPNIGLDTLRLKVKEAMEGDKPPEPQDDSPIVKKDETTGEKRVRLTKKASRLVRVNVTCMNPNKKEYEGEIFTVSNSFVGTHKKFIPFNTTDGWHIPHIIYQQIINRKCQVFVTKKGPNGQKTRKGKLIKEYSVAVLPDLSQEEIDQLEIKQAVGNSIDD